MAGCQNYNGSGHAVCETTQPGSVGKLSCARRFLRLSGMKRTESLGEMAKNGGGCSGARCEVQVQGVSGTTSGVVTTGQLAR
jgi:hypothetical protein